LKQPKNSSKSPPPPPDLIEAAKEADSEVEMDVMEKLGSFMEAMQPAERRALESTSLALASKIVGEPIASDQAMQAFAVALTALNAYRDSTGEGPIDPEAVNPMMLDSMLEAMIRDEDFMEFIAGEVELEEDTMDEDLEEAEGSMVEPAESLMNRRTTLMGAI
jgi:hypothetical protein